MKRMLIILLAAFFAITMTGNAYARGGSAAGGGGGSGRTHNDGHSSHRSAGTHKDPSHGYIKKCKTAACMKKHPKGDYYVPASKR